MPYNFPVPMSRGPKPNEIFTAYAAPSSFSSAISDVILHSLIVRIAYQDNFTEEFNTILQDDVLDLDIPQDRLDLLTTTIDFGPKLNQFRSWLFSGPEGPEGPEGPQGSLNYDVISVTSDYTVQNTIDNYSILLVDATLGDITINMTSMPNTHVLIIKKIDITNHAIIFNVTIDGENNPSIMTPYESFTIVKYSSMYYLI